MNFQCPFCSFILRDLEASILGKKVECPNCGGKSHIPNNPFDAGRVIGDYIIKRKIGEGSVGAVFLAQQISLDRTVALKILSEKYSSDEKGLASFLQEARAAASLNHPNLVQAFGVGKEENVCFMAMTYLKGDTLKLRLKRDKRIPPDEAMHIAQQVAEALHYAWTETGIIHRDVKPDNIIITDTGVVKLTDLGLAIRQQDWHENLDVSGSPSYMSPEQFSGDKLDSRSDIYSLGITLYQMLAGRLPFEAETVREVARQHFYDEAPSLQKLDPTMPPKVIALVRKMIAKDPKDRCQTMEEVLKAIWEIRQKTAPDRELVPDVHTISMKRLDYDLQRLSKKKQAQVRHARRTEEAKPAGRRLPLLLTLAFGFLLAGTYYAFHRNTEAQLATKQRLLDGVATMFNHSSATPEEQLIDCQAAIATFGQPEDAAQRRVRAELEVIHQRIQNRILVQRNQTLRSDLERYETLHSQNLSQLDDRKKALSVAVAEQERARTETETILRQSLATAEGNCRNAIDELARLKIQHDRLASDYREFWQDDLRVRAYALLRQWRFREAAAILRAAAESNPESREWFTSMTNRIDRMEKLFQGFSASGNHFQGLALPEGRIVRISEEKVFLQANDNSFPIMPWQSLGLNSLLLLGQKICLEVPENALKAEIAILAGRLAEARLLLADSTEMGKVCDAIIRASIEQVRMLLEVDRKRAATKANILFREFSGIPEFTARYQSELRGLFETTTELPPSSP